MTKYVYRNGALVNKDTGEPLAIESKEICAPYITSDIPAYFSHASGKWVEGRSARREDMKRAGVRELDPSEFKPQYRDKKRAERNKGEWNPDANRQTMKYTGFLA